MMELSRLFFGVRAQAMREWVWKEWRREKEHSEEEGGENVL